MNTALLHGYARNVAIAVGPLILMAFPDITIFYAQDSNRLASTRSSTQELADTQPVAKRGGGTSTGTLKGTSMRLTAYGCE